MGFLNFNKIGGMFFSGLQPDLSNLDAAERFKIAKKHLSGEKGAQFKQSIGEATRIAQMNQFVNEKQRLDSPEARDLRLKDGTAWLNLVLMSYAKDKSVLATVMDLPMQMKQVMAAEKQKRADMPEAKQKILSAAIHDIERGILTVESPKPLAANDNTASMQAANDTMPQTKAANDNDQSALDKAA
jgi:hypothetical protein